MPDYQDTIAVLLIFITVLVGIIAYLNWRINELAKRIDLMGGLVFGMMHAIELIRDALSSTEEVISEMQDNYVEFLDFFAEQEEEHEPVGHRTRNRSEEPVSSDNATD